MRGCLSVIISLLFIFLLLAFAGFAWQIGEQAARAIL